MIAEKSTIRVPKVSTWAVIVGAAVLVPVVVGSVIETPKPSAAGKAADLAAAAEDLVKSIEPTVTNATSYKSGSDDVEHKAFVVAILANAVSESEGEATWKGSALAVRDAALELAKAKSQPNAEKAFKSLQGLLGGGGSTEGKPMKYLDVASLTHVMKEVNERNKAINKNVKGTSFARNKQVLARDAQVWALLAAIARDDTKSAETAKKPQADYQKYSDAFFTSSKALAAAAAKGDQSAASAANKEARRACADCHAVFRPDIE